MRALGVRRLVAYRCKITSRAAAYLGGKFMEWFSQKTSIGGYQIPNWALVLGAIIVIWLIYEFIT